MAEGARTDSEPAERAAERLTLLVKTHFAFVWRMLRRLGLPDADADDGAQRVFLVLAQRLQDVQGGSERAFLFRTAVNVAYKARRARRRRPERPEAGAGEAVCPGLDPEQALVQRRAREALDALLERMPRELRVVFVSYEIEQLTMAEIAEALGMAPGTVASRLRRAREFFARQGRRGARGEER